MSRAETTVSDPISTLPAPKHNYALEGSMAREGAQNECCETEGLHASKRRHMEGVISLKQQHRGNEGLCLICSVLIYVQYVCKRVVCRRCYIDMPVPLSLSPDKACSAGEELSPVAKNRFRYWCARSHLFAFARLFRHFFTRRFCETLAAFNQLWLLVEGPECVLVNWYCNTTGVTNGRGHLAIAPRRGGNSCVQKGHVG